MIELKKGDFETLHQKAMEVERGEDVSDLISQMWKIMFKNKGVGLAANQVGVLKRVIIVNTNGFSCAIINPVITELSGFVKNSKEGCLSFPGKQSVMKRDNRVIIEGFDADWNPIKKKVRALSAFCVQHEIDHLNGINI